jgi:Lrp/AsnC family leucine-responsive transcriptional regulator
MIARDDRKAIDRVDRAILSALQRDGRITNVELAREVNLSPSPCLERVRRLEATGYIHGYSASINASLMGFGTTAFVEVTLDRSTSDVFDRFRDAVVKLPSVAECHMLAGGFDYLVKLRFASMEEYRDVLAMLVDLPGVAQTHTYVVIEQVKRDSGLPI